MYPMRNYWLKVLREHLEEQSPGVLVVVPTQTVSILRIVRNSPTTATFDEGSAIHIDDPEELKAEGTHWRNQIAINIPCDRISSITFSYHGPKPPERLTVREFLDSP